MAYKALYRSYRPQDFDEIAGQYHIVKTLKNAVKQNKIAHAYLFCGPRGTGKTTIAKILAKAINCTCQDINKVPCNQCENCLSIMKGTHPDIVEIDAASNNGVDEVRDLIEKVKYAPIEGKYKVYIIDEVHMMSTGAFNALLKTLEEPPAHVVFVLATTEPQKILPTIISRCQRFDFNKITDKDIVERLKTVLASENIQCDDEALELIASLADGGMRDALSILEQCLAYSSKLSVKDINEIYGIVSLKQKIQYLKSLMNKDMPTILKSIEEMFQSGIDVKRLTTDLIDILKDVVIYKNTNRTEDLFILNQNEINQIVPYITIEETFEYIDILIQADQQYKFASNAKLYFEIASLKIANNISEKTQTIYPKKEEKKLNNIYTDNTEINLIKNEEKPKYQKLDEKIIEEINEEPPSTITYEYENEKQKDNVTIDIGLNQDNIELTNENNPKQKNKEQQENKQDKNIIIKQENIEVDFNDILNILVQANRKILNNIQEKWTVIRRYQFNLNTAKLASMLCDGQPVAASEHGLIIAFEFQPSVNQINNGEYYIELKQFLKEVLGEEYDFIAILKSEWPNIRNKFIELKGKKLLPEPKPIILSHIQTKSVQKEIEQTLTEAEKFGIKLFGEIVEIKEHNQ